MIPFGLFIFLTSVGSTVFGYFALPHIVDFIILKSKFNAFRAAWIAKRAQRNRRRKFENSSAYSTRLAEVLKLIKDTANESDETYVKISYLVGCETDQEIDRELKRRGFDTWYNEENTLKISW